MGDHRDASLLGSRTVRHHTCSASSAVDNRRHVGSDSKDCMVVLKSLFAIGHYNIIIKLLIM